MLLKKQPLNDYYAFKFGFKTASIMDYNMQFDHDNIAKNHNNPRVAFMVNTNSEVETKSFNKYQYDEAKAYQMSFVKEAKVGNSIVGLENTGINFDNGNGLNKITEAFIDSHQEETKLAKYLKARNLTLFINT